MEQTAHGPVLKVEDLEVTYRTRQGLQAAVRGVSFELWAGDALGLVGESGCGKSTLAFAIMNYVAPNAKVTQGRILFCGEDLLRKSEAELDEIRGNRIAMVYQDPLAALNPCLRIRDQLTEVLTQHQGRPGQAAANMGQEMLERVHMPDPATVMQRYPHQLSGGQQQRVLIAMALLTNPALLILDEPTAGLDVTIEAGILDLINEVKREFHSTILYITHNLGVVSQVADQVAVMYAGEMVERGSARDIFLKPLHPYTEALFRCMPKITGSRRSGLNPIRGRVPVLYTRPAGCIFEPRCDRADEYCRSHHPDLALADVEHPVRCFYAHRPDRRPQDTPPAMWIDVRPGPDGKAPVLKTEDLRAYYAAQGRGLAGLAGTLHKDSVKAVDGVSFAVQRGSTFGIVGESGCGKTTLAKCVAGLVPSSGGQIIFLDLSLSQVVEKRPRELLKELQMVFQNPDSTLNPSRSVGETIARPLHLFGTVAGADVKQAVVGLLEAVKLGAEIYSRLPSQLSGGEKQRVAIARAFAGRPTIVLCDEPLSALDVSVQAAVLNLLLEFQQKYGTTMLFISHDLSVVHQLCDNVAVMYLGQFCEIVPTEALFDPPYHPYTEALLSAVPSPDLGVQKTSLRLTGPVPSAINPPPGCRFHTRCPRKIGAICEEMPPPWRKVTDRHWIHCHISLEELKAVEPLVSASIENRPI